MDPDQDFLPRHRAGSKSQYNQSMFNPLQPVSHAFASPTYMPLPMQLPYHTNGIIFAPEPPMAPPQAWGYVPQQVPYGCYNAQPLGDRLVNPWNTYTWGGNCGSGPGMLHLGVNGILFAQSPEYGAGFRITEDHLPASYWNPALRVGYAPLYHGGDKSCHQRPTAEQHRQGHRARRRPHYRHQLLPRHRQSTEEDPAREIAPMTPRRSPAVAARLQHERRTPLKGILQSARRMSKGLFPAARGKACDISNDDDDDDEDYDEGECYSDDGQRSMLPTPLRMRRRTTRSKHGARVKWASPTTHGLSSSTFPRDERKYTTYVRRSAKRSRERRRPQADQQQQDPTGRKSERTAASKSVDLDTSDAHSSNASPSDMSDFAGNQDILKMNGLLDVWDARGNLGWEEETFALCDLGRCPGCGKFYVPMRTLRHVCRA